MLTFLFRKTTINKIHYVNHLTENSSLFTKFTALFYCFPMAHLLPHVDYLSTDRYEWGQRARLNEIVSETN